MIEKYLTRDELARIGHCTPQAISMMRMRGEGPQGTKFGRRVLYAESAVQAWLDARNDDVIGRATRKK